MLIKTTYEQLEKLLKLLDDACKKISTEINKVKKYDTSDTPPVYHFTHENKWISGLEKIINNKKLTACDVFYIPEILTVINNKIKALEDRIKLISQIDPETLKIVNENIPALGEKIDLISQDNHTVLAKSLKAIQETLLTLTEIYKLFGENFFDTKQLKTDLENASKKIDIKKYSELQSLSQMVNNYKQLTPDGKLTNELYQDTLRAILYTLEAVKEYQETNNEYKNTNKDIIDLESFKRQFESHRKQIGDLHEAFKDLTIAKPSLVDKVWAFFSQNISTELTKTEQTHNKLINNFRTIISSLLKKINDTLNKLENTGDNTNRSYELK